MKKNFFNFLKKKVLKVYLADLVFFSFLLWLTVYARNKLFSYLVVLQQFAPKLADVSSSLNAEDASSVAQLDALLKVIGPIVSEAKIFIFFVVPVLLFFLWVLFQGVGWNFLKQDSFKKVFDIRFYPKFALLSIPIFAIIFYLFSDFMNVAENFNLTKYVILLILLIIVFYFTLASYLVVGKDRFLPNFFNLSIKKAKLFLPSFFLLIFILLLVLILFFNAFIAVLSLAVPPVLTMVLLLFFILFFSSSKCLLVYIAE